MANLFRTEAALYTFDVLRKKLNDDKTGLLIIDSCGGKLLNSRYMYDILTKAIEICDNSQQCLDPENIVTFHGFSMSSLTRHVS